MHSPVSRCWPGKLTHRQRLLRSYRGRYRLWRMKMRIKEGGPWSARAPSLLKASRSLISTGVRVTKLSWSLTLWLIAALIKGGSNNNNWRNLLLRPPLASNLTTIGWTSWAMAARSAVPRGCSWMRLRLMDLGISCQPSGLSTRRSSPKPREARRRTAATTTS